MREYPPSESYEDKERAKKIEEILRGVEEMIKAVPQMEGQDAKTRKFYPRGFDLIFSFIDGDSPMASIELDRSQTFPFWVDPGQYSGPTIYERILYIFEDGNVFKEGKYDSMLSDEQLSLVFLNDQIKVDRLAVAHPFVDYFLSPEVYDSELSILLKIMQDPVGHGKLIEKIPSPSTWYRPQ